MTPIPKNVFATKLLAPKFCAECTDQQLHSSHGDYFRCHFCVYVSGPLSSNLRATFGQLWTIGGSGDSKIRSGSPGVWPICDKILHVARPDPATLCIGSFWHIFHCIHPTRVAQLPPPLLTLPSVGCGANQWLHWPAPGSRGGGWDKAVGKFPEMLVHFLWKRENQHTILNPKCQR